MNKKLLLLIFEKNRLLTQLKNELEANDFEVITAQDGQSGFELARKTEPNLILAAMQLQHLDGIDLCYMVRQSSNISSIPYILVGDKFGPEERINAFRSGVDTIIDTSVSMRELSTRIDTLLKRFEMANKKQLPPNQSLMGSISDFRLVEILQMLNLNQKSGMLFAYNQNQNGQIAFFEGRLTWARIDTTDGEAAVQKMMAWQDGLFIFEKDLIQPDSNITKPTMQLILDCCQSLDELTM
ncbi:MAG: DUF4388 domain-containing protein [Candidatus Zhuqueibacterota bacterium]